MDEPPAARFAVATGAGPLPRRRVFARVERGEPAADSLRRQLPRAGKRHIHSFEPRDGTGRESIVAEAWAAAREPTA